MSLGRRISKGVPAESPVPELLGYLPTEGLIPESVQYFHTQATLNFLYFLASTNLLNLGPETEAALARYSTAKGKVRLLLVRYPSTDAALAAYDQFGTTYLSERPAAGASQRGEKMETGDFVGASHTGRFLTLVFEARTLETCTRLTEESQSRIERGKP